MKKILIVLGKSASGKDFITNFLEYEKKFKKVVSYTTRPKRKGEVDGVNYHYTNNKTFEEMLKNGKFIEYTYYIVNDEKWYYGYTEEVFLENKINIVVCNPMGYRKIKEIFPQSISVYLYADTSVRKKRYLERDAFATEELWNIRFKQDENDFASLKDDNSIIRIDNSKEVDYPSEIIKELKGLF